MRRDEVLAILAEHQDEIRAQGVTSLSLFGSVARDEAGPESDVDILVEIGQRPFSLLDLAGLQIYLEEILDCKVDLITTGAIKEQLRDRILQESIRAA